MAALLPETADSAAISAAVEENQWSWFEMLKLIPNHLHYASPLYSQVVTGMFGPLFNPIWNVRLTEANADAAITEAIARAHSRNAMTLWWNGPRSTPADLDARLTAKGLNRFDEQPGMYRVLTNLPTSPSPEGFEMKQAADESGLAQLGIALARANEWPTHVANIFVDFNRQVGYNDDVQRHYVGYLNGEPVACASLSLAGGVAGIYSVATAPQCRRKGIASAMTLGLMRIAAAKGYRIVILLSTPAGFPVYTRLGFKEICRVRMFVGAVPT